MQKVVWLILAILLLSCHKDPMVQRGFLPLEVFNWSIDEELNQLTIKFAPEDVTANPISSVIVRIRVDAIDLENVYSNPMVKVDIDELSPYHDRKVIELKWIPSLELTPDTLEFVRVYLKF